MKIHNLNSETAGNNEFINYIKEQYNRDYVIFFSGGAHLYTLYKLLATDFNYPFPRYIVLGDESYTKNSPKEYSTLAMIKESGLLGRIKWENTQFYKVARVGDPEAEKAHEKALQELFQTVRNMDTIGVFDMHPDGGFSSVTPNSEAVNSDKYFVKMQDVDNVVYSITLQTIMEHIKKHILYVASDETCGMFTRVLNFESDMRDYPVLAFKNLPHVNVYCYPEQK